jgi:hypothetical protein
MLGRSGLQVSGMFSRNRDRRQQREEDEEMFVLFTRYVFDVLAIVKVGRHSSAADADVD